MTRLFVVLAIIGLVATVVLGIAGFSGNAPGLMIAALCLSGPAFLLCLGIALGRASNEFRLVTVEQNYISDSRQPSSRRRRAHMDESVLSG